MEPGATPYAHSTSRSDCSDWETLEEHLTRVGARAALYARRFAPELASTAGLLHDLGKAKPRFQAKLLGEHNSESHSGEGARAAAERIKPSGLGKLLAFVIAGHHSGMPNALARDGNGRPSTPLIDRLNQAEDFDLPTGLGPDLDPRRLFPTQLQAPPCRVFMAQFLGRMVFSALVDADRTETAAFYEGLTGKSHPDRPAASLTALRAALWRHLSRFEGADGPVNAIRAEVLKALQEKAQAAPGLFSLTVPTGGGKTLASLAFALDHAIAHGLDRVIYVIPYTSIVEQTAAVFRGALSDPAAVIEHHTAFDWESLDTGEDEARALREASMRWDGPVIVTTAVQFLESLFSNRPGRCRKLHRLAGAVVVMDEAQTLPLRLLRPSLAAVKELVRGYETTIVLCTATQPALTCEEGFAVPEALTRAAGDPMAMRELAPDPFRLQRALKRVEVKAAGDLADADLASMLREPEGGLAIVNNRAHAKMLFGLIRDARHAFHLSTDMTAAHRRAILHEVRAGLSTGAVRLVSTSLVEAGVDVDFPRVYRAIAGLDSIAQAAGRCNREGRRAIGEVVVFRPESRHAMPRDLKKCADVAAEVLALHADPLSLDAIRDYFARLYRDLGHGMDGGASRKEGVLEMISASGSALDIPYADIAAAFRVIEDGGLPVVIVGEPWGVPEETLKQLSFQPYAGAAARTLQRYQVQVPARVRGAMLRDGVVHPWRPEDFGDQFIFLAMEQLYDAHTGLNWQDYGDLGTMIV